MNFESQCSCCRNCNSDPSNVVTSTVSIIVDAAGIATEIHVNVAQNVENIIAGAVIDVEDIPVTAIKK